MPKFKIYVETRQCWVCETELENEEAAKALQMKLYDVVQRQIQNSEGGICDAIEMSGVLNFDIEAPSSNTFVQEDYWGADDFSDDDIINVDVENTPVGSTNLIQSESIHITCPDCGSETDYDDESDEFGEIYKAIENDGKLYLMTCDLCGTTFKVDYLKKV